MVGSKPAVKAAVPEPANVADTDSVPPMMDTAKSSGELGGKPPARGTANVRHVSAQATADSTRVTIVLDDNVQFSSGRLKSPDRIFFDLHSAHVPSGVAKDIRVEGNLLTGVRVAQNQSGIVRVVLDVNGVKDYNASLLNHPPQLVIELYPGAMPPDAMRAKVEDAAGSGDAEGETKPKTPESAIAASTKPVVQETSVDDTDSVPAPVPAPVATTKSSRKGKNGKPDLVQPPTVPSPTRDGESTLTRALGLKIGRIVIDAGHGGHDTGTIGPTGLMEKDLCLDVALRLGKIIHQRLPGADVLYTRSDDTFIPLEERTHIANQAKADLFISIHANSSHDNQARGIETYYLNLKGSPEAMEVAARENASSQEGIHDLQDVVKQIARTEKIDESKEFAEDVQDALSKRIQKQTHQAKNRGVRKAPFVVLIGADMPSILTEISFLSNPADEKALKQPDQRQRVAEGIYQGVASYLQSMNSVTVNSQESTKARPTPVSTTEQTRNRN